MGPTASDLLTEDDVYLVTIDSAFYAGRDYPGGLAANLRDEAAAVSPRDLKLFHNLAGLLEDIRKDVQIDDNKLVDAFLAAHSAGVERILDRAGFVKDSR